MPQIISGISYHQIKHMFDWQLTDDAHRLALAQIVNGIGDTEVTLAWGEGKTAAGDGQRFGYHKKTIHRTFSHKFNDFAIELYIFVADNYALFYNLAKEATDKDTSKVLDAYLYNDVGTNIEHQLQDAYNKGLAAGANEVRKDFITTLDNHEI